MDTSKWGPHAWFFLHTVAYNYPANPTEEKKAEYRQFFTNLASILPCVYCRNSYTNFLQTYPITSEVLANHLSFNRWFYLIHSKVNEKLGKKNITFAQMMAKYEKVKSKKHHQ